MKPVAPVTRAVRSRSAHSAPGIRAAACTDRVGVKRLGAESICELSRAGTLATDQHGRSRRKVRLIPSATSRTARGVTAASTTIRAELRPTAESTIVSIGVSLPRNVMRQPRSRRTRPKAISPRSCRSPGGQARRARGPLPAPQLRPNDSIRARRIPVAKCSCATEISPSSQRLPISCITGRNIRLATASIVKRARASSRIALASVSSKRSRAASSLGPWSPTASRAPRGPAGDSGPDDASLAASDGRYTRVDQPLHRSHPLLVASAVEAEATGAALRMKQAIAALPGAQRVDADAGPAAELADPY